jgi:hypothetical protein
VAVLEEITTYLVRHLINDEFVRFTDTELFKTPSSKKRGRPTNAKKYGTKKDGTPKKKPGRKKTKQS